MSTYVLHVFIMLILLANCHNFLVFCADLVPKENVEAWLKYLRKELPTVAFKASTQSQKNNLVSYTDASCHF